MTQLSFVFLRNSCDTTQLFSWWKANIQTYPTLWRSHLMSSFHLRAVAMTQAPAIGNCFASKNDGLILLPSTRRSLANTPKLCWPLGLSNVSNEWKKLSNSIRPLASTYHFSYDVDGTNRTKVCWVWPVQKEYFLYSSHLPRQASWILRQQIQIWQFLELSWYVHRN